MRLLFGTKYAKEKGLSRQYIYRLIKNGLLLTHETLGKKLVIDCQENDNVLKNKKNN